jgi:tellurite resistance protein TerC
MPETSVLFVHEWLGKPVWQWLMFLGLIVVLLVLDLGLIHRTARKPSFKESLGWTIFYTAVSLCFGVWVWFQMGATRGMEFFTGYAMELSLSFDNVFVISLIFSALSIPSSYQQRVLLWGVIGVLVMRGLMIGLGTALVLEFQWILAVFGVFLLVTGVKMFFMHGGEKDIKDNKLLRWMNRHLLITPELHGKKFFVRLPVPGQVMQKIWATPLFIALVLVETADVIFAVDSVPAIFAVTLDPYIVYTSNIFAVLGLRALYFTLANAVNRFQYLSKALAFILVFIGGKIIYTQFLGGHIPTWISLMVVLAFISGGIAFSLLKTAKKPNNANARH